MSGNEASALLACPHQLYFVGVHLDGVQNKANVAELAHQGRIEPNLVYAALCKEQTHCRERHDLQGTKPPTLHCKYGRNKANA
jgi:hypothetical protein